MTEEQANEKYLEYLQGHRASNVDVTERGSFYYFKDNDGNDVKKKIGSNGTTVTRLKESATVSYVAYHATPSEPFEQYDFDKTPITGMTLGDGAYFTTSKAEINSLANGVINGEVRYVLKAQITLNNPYNMRSQDTSNLYSKVLELDKVRADYEDATRYIEGKMSRGGRIAFDYLDGLAERLDIKTSDLMKQLGFDGIVDGDYLVAYSNDEIKQIKWMTFDEFNTINESLDTSSITITDEERQNVIDKTKSNMNSHPYKEYIMFVPLDILDKVKEYDRAERPMYDDKGFKELCDKIKANGITEPGFIDYNPNNGQLKLGEGNHRLLICKLFGLDSMPVYCSRSKYMEDGKYSVDPKNITPYAKDCFGGYTYAESMNPKYLGEPFGENFDGEHTIEMIGKINEEEQIGDKVPGKYSKYVKYMYKAGDGSYIVELNEPYMTGYDTSYIQSKNKKTAIEELEYEIKTSFKYEEDNLNESVLNEMKLSQIKQKSKAEDPARIKKSRNVKTTYIGMSKFGILNFKTTSESRNGYHYQTLEFKDMKPFEDIIKTGKDIMPADIKKQLQDQDVNIFCTDESFSYWAWAHQAYKNDFLYIDDRIPDLNKRIQAPTINNVRLNGGACKHILSLIDYVTRPFVLLAISDDMQKYLANTGEDKANKQTVAVQNQYDQVAQWDWSDIEKYTGLSRVQIMSDISKTLQIVPSVNREEVIEDIVNEALPDEDQGLIRNAVEAIENNIENNNK